MDTEVSKRIIDNPTRVVDTKFMENENISFDVDPASTPPPVPTPKPNRLIIIVSAIVIFLLLAVGASAFYFGKMFGPPKQVACTMEAKLCSDGTSVGRTGSNCEFSPCPTSAVDPTANWQTYKTAIIEVKYPSDWYLEKADPKSIYPTTDRLRNYDINVYADAITKQKKNTPDGFSNLFGIDLRTHEDVIKSKPTNVVLIDFVKANAINPTSNNFEEITVDGLPAVKVTTKNSTITNLLNFDLETHILKNDKVYVVVGFIEHPIFTQDGIKGFQRIYDQILSTFKFTN